MQEENITLGNFSLRLLETMKRRQLTQKELAFMTDLSQGAISKYLRGSTLPKSMELYRMSKALGVTMEWLLGDDEIPIPDNDGYWQREAIRLKAQLNMAVSTLEGALTSLRTKR